MFQFTLWIDGENTHNWYTDGSICPNILQKKRQNFFDETFPKQRETKILTLMRLP